jgi:hypothetical protein
MFLSVQCFPQEKSIFSDIKVSAGYSVLIYQSVFAMDMTSGPEFTVDIPLAANWNMAAGCRLGLNPVLPEGFVRMSLNQKMEFWNPCIGIEFGITNRTYFTGSNSKLLQETREALLEDIGPFYLSVHAAPASFTFTNNWHLSVLEVNIGSHIDHMGRTMRLNLGFVTLGKTF